MYLQGGAWSAWRIIKELWDSRGHPGVHSDVDIPKGNSLHSHNQSGVRKDKRVKGRNCAKAKEVRGRGPTLQGWSVSGRWKMRG